MKKYSTVFMLFFILSTAKAQLPCTASFTDSINGNNLMYFPSVYTTPDSQYIINHWWSFGDGSSSQLSHPSHMYSQCGTYIVNHTIQTYNANRVYICGDTVVQTITIACNTPCGVQANFQGAASANQSNLYEFINNSSVSSTNTGTVTAFWNFGDGSSLTTNAITNPTHVYSNAGTYTVCLLVTISQNPGTISCSDTFCQNFRVVLSDTNPCNIVASFDTTILQNQSNLFAFSNTSFMDSSQNYYTSWDFGDSTTAAGNHVTHTYSQSGDYNVCMHLNVNNSCTADTCILVHVIMPSVDSTSSSTPLISYPNPAQSNVRVNVSLNQASSIYAAIYNAQSSMVSQLVQAGNTGNNVLSFNISNLPAGLYTIRIYCDNQVYVSRFQKM